ncbi:hypothetical protein LUZ60_017612 [Juncus effusus]|nr:hypothetical protein LUZ60_017612 [Juncus effusus]
MGSVLSTTSTHSQSREKAEHNYQSYPNKRLKLSPPDIYEETRLIPSLPDEISLQILARIPRCHHLKIKSINRLWKSAITSHEIFNLRKELGVTEEWIYILTKVDSNNLNWYGLDPISGFWQKLPPMPTSIREEETMNNRTRGFDGPNGLRIWNIIGSTIRSWLSRNTRSEQLPFCGAAVAASGACLYVIGGFAKSLALNVVWRYDPRTNSWAQTENMNSGRAFCKTTVLDNKIYAIGGVSRGLNGRLNPLRSGEVFDPVTRKWDSIPDMPFNKAQVLPAAFLADVLKPVATGMVMFRERLFVTQSLYSWPFFFDIGGEVFDPSSGTWSQMPSGMGEGWPARQAGTKLGLVVNGSLYALEPSGTLDGGIIKRYDESGDVWRVVMGRVPVQDFRESEAPFLLARFHDRLHVITKDVDNNIAVWMASTIDGVAGEGSRSDSHTQENETNEDNNNNNSSNNSNDNGNNNGWRLVAARNFGSAELVSCQVLDI